MTDDDDIDIFADAESGPSEGQLGRLTGLFAKKQEIEGEIELLEAELKSKKDALRDLDEKQLPELMDEAGVNSFGAGNHQVTLQTKLYGSLPSTDPQELQAALDELDRWGGTPLVKTSVSLSLPKGEAEMARDLQKRLARYTGQTVQLKEAVHPSSLQSWARERLERGDNLDLRKLGLYRRRFVKVT
jgi:hypothetical protein